VAEAARNLVCSGAEPAAVTDCLNFPNPEKPDRFWQFKNCVEGIIDACTFFNLPVISGNVSFYNESPNGPINPTPTIGMVGIIDDRSRIATQNFKKENDAIILLGVTKNELGGSEYLKELHDAVAGDAPELNLGREKAVQDAALEIIRAGLAHSAHDCSEGGLAVALAESCISDEENMIGAVIDTLNIDTRVDAALFGESQSRIILSCALENTSLIEGIARKYSAPCQVIGRTGGTVLKIVSNEKELINTPLKRISASWRNSLQSSITV